MRPNIHDLFAGVALALRNLAFVVREDVVHAARVNVDSRTKILDGHRRTFDMPAGKAFAPLAGPFQVPARLSRFPQRKVAWVALQRVCFNAHGFQQICLRDVAGQLAVIGELGNFVIHIAVYFVRKPAFHKALGDFEHLRHMVGRLGELHRGNDI